MPCLKETNELSKIDTSRTEANEKRITLPLSLTPSLLQISNPCSPSGPTSQTQTDRIVQLFLCCKTKKLNNTMDLNLDQIPRPGLGPMRDKRCRECVGWQTPVT